MGKLVLIVDDSPTMLMSVRSTLEMRGFGVEAASDGELALAKLQGGLKPDLIITDVHMPKMSGLQFIKLLRELPGFRFTPVLTLTTETDASKRDEAKKLGATGWLVKPTSGADLLSVISRVLPGV
ncbi:MAG TPA: response regulator [Cellvibrionaceae bacterium]|nr:response regulator [Cellvibrionaceae bacterium]